VVSTESGQGYVSTIGHSVLHSNNAGSEFGKPEIEKVRVQICAEQHWLSTAYSCNCRYKTVPTVEKYLEISTASSIIVLTRVSVPSGNQSK
jgi:hypothetical protein